MKSTNVGMSLINVWSVVFIVRNERHASTPSECGMLVCREFTSMVTSKDSGVTKCVMSFSLIEKICGVFEKAGYFVKKCFQNGINISLNVFG